MVQDEESNDSIEDIDELKKLSPKKRIEALRSFFEKNKKEAEKAEKLLKKSEDEIKDTETRLQELIPKQEQVDISDLFRRGQETLEEQVSHEQIVADHDQVRVEYSTKLISELAESPSDSIYKIMEGIYQGFQSTGYVSNDHLTVMYSALEATMEKMDSIRSGEYSASKEASRKLVASLDIANFLKDRYRA